MNILARFVRRAEKSTKRKLVEVDKPRNERKLPSPILGPYKSQQIVAIEDFEDDEEVLQIELPEVDLNEMIMLEETVDEPLAICGLNESFRAIEINNEETKGKG